MLTPLQCKLARTALGWSVRDFARAAKIAPNTITRFETGKGTPMRANLTIMRQTFVAAGIEFLNGDGIRLRRPDSRP